MARFSDDDNFVRVKGVQYKNNAIQAVDDVIVQFKDKNILRGLQSAKEAISREELDSANELMRAIAGMFEGMANVLENNVKRLQEFGAK